MLIEIPLSEDLRICSPDPLNYTVERRRVVKSGPNAGKSQWDVLGYHGSLAAAASSALKNHSNALSDPEKVTELKTLIEIIEEWGRAICTQCKIAAPKVAERDEMVKKPRQPITEEPLQ